MTVIRIDNTGNGTSWLYGKTEDWKEYVTDDFDEKVVLFGNRYFHEICNASWYKNAEEILEMIDCYDEYPSDVSDDVCVKLKDLYEKCRCTEDIIFDVIQLLNTGYEFEKGTIRGCSQGDWQEYIIRKEVDVNVLESFFFGNVACVMVEAEDEDFFDVITDDELWSAQGNLKEYMKERYELSDNEEVHIFEAKECMAISWSEIF